MGDTVVATWYTGNAADDGSQDRGWILGHFKRPMDDVRSTKDVEVKWAIHSAGEQRSQWTKDDQRTTVVLLVQGHFRVDLTEGAATLNRQGDYVLWGPGIDHSYEALEDSVVIVVRWPSYALKSSS
jgi:hypothetical protein